MFKRLRWMGIVTAGLLLSLDLAMAQPYTLKIGSGTVNDTSQEWLRLFKAGVEQRSGGKLKVETYVASALGPNPRLVEGVALGTIEAGVPNTGFWVSLEPRFVVFDAVGIFDSPEQSVKVLQDPTIHKLISSYGTEKGVETISVFWHSPLAVMTKKPIRTVADFAGLKLRPPGGAPLAVKPVEKLKASPISMPIMDALRALQNGAIDGIISGSTVGATLKYYDVAKYMTVLPKSMIFVAAVANSGVHAEDSDLSSRYCPGRSAKGGSASRELGRGRREKRLGGMEEKWRCADRVDRQAADDYLTDVTEVAPVNPLAKPRCHCRLQHVLGSIEEISLSVTTMRRRSSPLCRPPFGYAAQRKKSLRTPEAWPAKGRASGTLERVQFVMAPDVIRAHENCGTRYASVGPCNHFSPRSQLPAISISVKGIPLRLSNALAAAQ